MRLNVALVLLFREIFCYNYTTKFIDVPLDHFSFTNNATFKLKYLINDSFWIDDGPIFFYTGNEGAVETFAENTGFIFDIAPTFNALIVFAEHRYYGATLPFGNASFSNPGHLGFLTSSQALADYVYLINHLQTTHQRSEYLSKVPVVAFGGSYGGMLAAWLRMKYPASVVGAIAASAPIWQFQGLTPCENFNRIVSNVYKTAVDDDCSAPIQKSWKIIRNITANDDGKAWLTKAWKLCSPLKSSDIDDLLEWYSEILVNMAMVNYPYPTKFLAPLPAFPVRNFCYKLTGEKITDDKSLVTAIGNALEIYTNFTKATKCNNINQTAASLGEEGWDFQACTEMIMPMCSDDNDMFENQSWDFKKYSDKCYTKWGVRQTNAELPILEYGGKDITAASNIVFSNGLLDPWSSGGVLSNISSTVSSVIIPEGAHHLDLRGENRNDPKSVIEARQFHVSSIRKWITDFYYSRDKNYFKKSIFFNKITYTHGNNI
ncbi:lysosomal Pro-X carboxypeptidase [Tribolium castaneum]|uniref:Lysosomal Pro-X carboxypeptidase n=1 Tax=Tribolium castaneum TaxID=7070 RepID=D6W8E7_TRICA|nr:PREDICTED: lysosomal Pro-X carboxypeptidase [Tribolium castaneum]EFA10876.1 Lysosomal Pro-X carboxypeptidase-like Protein [Tribolium castaneum]|eukprot:XP_971305.1 PREDICTED: lysosomal Pro-X carboxypeptidase [Tribolium castaneum]